MYSQAYYLHEWIHEAFGTTEDAQKNQASDVFHYVRQLVVQKLQQAKSGQISREDAHKHIADAIHRYDLTTSQIHTLQQYLHENPLQTSEALNPETKQTIKKIGKGLLVAGAAIGAGYLAGQGLLHHVPMISQSTHQFGKAAASIVAGHIVSHHLHKPPSIDDQPDHQR